MADHDQLRRDLDNGTITIEDWLRAMIGKPKRNTMQRLVDKIRRAGW